MPPAPRRAVLFDFDGTLADTENVHVAAWERTFADMGLDIPESVSARAAEEDDRAFFADVMASRVIDGADAAGWVARKQALTRELLGDAPRLYRGAADLIDRLRGRVKLAIVTGTWRENVEAVLSSSGLADAFDLIVAKEDVAATKPDPAGYLLALKTLKIKPANAVAVEDSPSGLAAARGAGVRTVALGHRRPAGDWSDGATFVASLTDLDEAVAAIDLPAVL